MQRLIGLRFVAFNTAIFYDIENLLKGYSFTPEMAANLSLREILASIRNAPRVGEIAVQRAYANWSDSRLAILRGEINELGIDPIQVFGFGRDPKKNAADIQLAIEAVDLAHTRPALEVFVIVSGDGAFASLAKKLHEYGKTVIGCAYRLAANRTFQAVCDHFIWVADPDSEERSEIRTELPVPRAPGLSDPRNQRLPSRVKPLNEPPDARAILAKGREVLQWYVEDRACSKELASAAGMVLSPVQEALKYALPGFEPVRLGFPKFVEFLQWICRDSKVCVVRRRDNQPVLMLCAAARGAGEILPDLEARQPHTAEVYRLILATSPPILRLASSGETRSVIGWVATHPPDGKDLGSLIEEAVSGLQGEVASESVKQLTLALLAAGAFRREPEGVPLAEQQLTLREELASPQALLARLRETAKSKLAAALGEVHEEVLEEILGTG